MSFIIVATGLQREAQIIARSGVEVIACGGHRDTLGKRLDHDIRQKRPIGLMSIGIAGALAPGLAVGDVVVANDVEGDECDTAWTRQILGLLRGPDIDTADSLPLTKRGREHLVVGPRRVVGDNIVASARGKAALFEFTGGVSIDMESDIVAQAALQFELPFAVIRVISDTASQTLPAAACVPLKPDGGVDLPRVLESVARHPLQIPALIRTARDANLALKTLLRRLDELGPGLGCPYLG